MLFKHYFKPISLITLFLLLSCNNEKSHLSEIEGKRIEINDSIKPNEEIENFIAPYRKHVNSDLDSVIAYSRKVYTKKKIGNKLNTGIGNFMADAVLDQSNSVYNSRTGKNIDFTLLNYGGIRAAMPKGNITARTAYKIMPFENSVVVVSLKGSQVIDMMNYLSRSKEAHPVSRNVSVILDKDFKLLSAKINSKEIDKNAIYNVATNDYLYEGGNSMTFFKPNEDLHNLDYKIRNVLIDTFKKQDTLKLEADNRFIIKL